MSNGVNVINIHTRLMEYLFNNQKLDDNFHIARVMLLRSQDFPHMVLEDIALTAHTTTEAVNEFCRTLGYSNFQDICNNWNNIAEPDIYQEMIRISRSKGVHSALHFFDKESGRKMFEMFELINRDQLKRIAKKLAQAEHGTVLTGLHGFAAADFLVELSTCLGKDLFGMNRDANFYTLKSIVESEDIIFIISLTGHWISENKKILEVSPEASKKIILISYADLDEYQGSGVEVVSLKMMQDLFSPSFLSHTALQMFFLFLVVHLGILIENND